MKVLALTRYGRQGASSRMRFYQYQPWLETAGIDVTTAPLFSDAYVQDLQRNTKSLDEALRAYMGRVQALVNSRKFDLLWIEKEAFPWLPGWFEKAVLPRSIPYVLDYDDAVFHYYDQHRNFILKTILAGKHPALIRNAALVLAGNAYLADFAQRAGARSLEVLPTVIDLVRYPVTTLKQAKDGKMPCVGWIGQRDTAVCLVPYASLFERLRGNGQARFGAVGIDAQNLGLPMDSISWTESTEVESISSFDIGIMPLPDAPFQRGKCGYKLIQYMACGLPVVASPVGVNRELVVHGVNGFLAQTPEEWEHALKTLLADASLRQRMGQAGRHKVEQQYCIQITGPKLVTLLKTASENGEQNG